MKTTSLAVLLLLLSGCTMVKFVKSAPGQFPPNPPESVLIFYDPAAVPFKYVEIGRVFQDISDGSSHADADQIERIRNEAAAQGAEAVILDKASKFESRGMAYQGAAGARARGYQEYSGIAIRRLEPVTESTKAK